MISGERHYAAPSSPEAVVPNFSGDLPSFDHPLAYWGNGANVPLATLTEWRESVAARSARRMIVDVSWLGQLGFGSGNRISNRFLHSLVRRGYTPTTSLAIV